MATTNENKVDLQAAYVLHQRAYRETSAIIELFTIDYGRVSVVAKGIKNKKSPLKVALQSFSPLLVSWQGRGEMKTLTLAETNGQPLLLQNLSLFSGLYLNELLIRLLPRFDPSHDLFLHYAQCLSELSEAHNTEQSLRVFELHLLSSLGYELILDVDANNGMPIDPVKRYIYVQDKGLVESKLADQNNGISGRSLIALANESLSDQQALRDAKYLLRGVLGSLLGEKPLKTRELFQAFQRKGQP